MRGTKLAIFLASTLLLIATTAAGGANASSGRVRLAEPMRGRAALAAIGSDLPQVAAMQGTTAATLHRILMTDRTAWVYQRGWLFHVERAPSAEGPATDAAQTV